MHMNALYASFTNKIYSLQWEKNKTLFYFQMNACVYVSVYIRFTMKKPEEITQTLTLQRDPYCFYTISNVDFSRNG